MPQAEEANLTDDRIAGIAAIIMLAIVFVQEWELIDCKAPPPVWFKCYDQRGSDTWNPAAVRSIRIGEFMLVPRHAE